MALDPILEQPNTQVTPYLLQPGQFPSGILQARMVAATPVQANGDLYYSDGTNFVRLPVGTAGQYLTLVSGVPAWGNVVIPSLPTDGWITGDAMTYVSATTVTVVGDKTAVYSKGTRIKLTQTTAKYFAVSAASYNGVTGLTTLTLTGGTDYSVANAAITSPFYSYEINPQGYPTWFNYTTTWGGFSVNPTGTFRFKLDGPTCTVLFFDAAGGTSNATSFTFTLPLAAKLARSNFGTCFVGDNGSAQTTPGHLVSSAGSATVNVWKTFFGGAFTAANGKSFFPDPIVYEIN